MRSFPKYKHKIITYQRTNYLLLFEKLHLNYQKKQLAHFLGGWGGGGGGGCSDALVYDPVNIKGHLGYLKINNFCLFIWF